MKSKVAKLCFIVILDLYAVSCALTILSGVKQDLLLNIASILVAIAYTIGVYGKIRILQYVLLIFLLITGVGRLIDVFINFSKLNTSAVLGIVSGTLIIWIFLLLAWWKIYQMTDASSANTQLKPDRFRLLKTKKLALPATLATIAIAALSAHLFWGSRYFFFNTRNGTYNVWCFYGVTDSFPKEPDEWVESFWSSNSCENARARAFNPKLSPIK